jgi:prophage DNA circulation protein
MSWADNLLPASFRGVEFDMLSVDDGATRSLARHAYPYVDGADVEDMGRDSRTTSVRAIIFGDDYEIQLQDFLQVLDQRGAGPLVHPIFGRLESMQVSSYRIAHQAESPDSCTVTIEFEESVTAAPFFDRTLASQKADAVDDAADDVDAGASEQLTSGCADLAKQADTGSMSALSRISALRQQAVTFLLTLNNEVHGVLTSITDPIRDVLGFITDVTALCQALVDQIPLEVESLQNFASKAFNQVDRLLSSDSLLPVVASTTNSPASFAAWEATQAASAAATVPGPGVGPGAGYSVPASSSYPVAPADSLADSKLLTVHVACQRAIVKARVLAIVLASESNTPRLTPSQVEQLVNTVRAAINDAIDQVRDRYPLEQARPITEPLKTLALTVQESGRAVINARPALIVKSVDAPVPLRLLAHTWYGDQARALELLRLNNLSHPNCLNAGDKLNAYAK